jgi:hypothetical protein
VCLLFSLLGELFTGHMNHPLRDVLTGTLLELETASLYLVFGVDAAF